MDQFTFPFQPPMEDLKLVVDCDNGTKCYLFNTFCKNITPEQKREADRRILTIYHRSAVAALIHGEHETGEALP